MAEKQIYSDGEAEERLLSLLKAGKSPEEILETSDDPTLFHTLTPAREGILNWYPFSKEDTVLEVGAGMGAVTGLLCRQCGKVVALEASPLRADVIRARYPEADNLTVLTGEIGAYDTEERYDHVVIIGVLEYAAIVSDSPNPYGDMLRAAARLLKPNGTLLLAIENRFGLKYWLGAQEDHTGVPFEGVAGYHQGAKAGAYAKNGVRTFDKRTLEQMFSEAGLTEQRFYYPLPDYKFPSAVFSDAHLPSPEDAARLKFSYSQDATLIGNEQEVLQDIIRAGEFSFFANSFLLEATAGELSERYVAYATQKRDYNPAHNAMTRIYNDNTVEVLPVSQAAQPHVEQVYQNYLELLSRGVPVVPMEMTDGVLTVNYVDAPLGSAVFQEALLRGDEKGCLRLIDELKALLFQSSDLTQDGGNAVVEALGLGEEGEQMGSVLARGYVDMTFVNTFRIDGRLVCFDQEYVEKNIPVSYILYRAVKGAYTPNRTISLKKALAIAGIGEALAELYQRYERQWLMGLMNPCNLAHFDPMMYQPELTLRYQSSWSSGEIERLNTEVQQLGTWGHGLDKELKETRELVERVQEEARQTQETGQAEIDRLNGEVDKLGEWGRGLNEELNATRETLEKEQKQTAHERENNQQLSGEIDRLNGEVDKLGEWGRGLNEELNETRETLEREQKQTAHERENNQQLSGEIDRLNGEVDKLGTWGRGLDSELNETRETLNREREEARQAHEAGEAELAHERENNQQLSGEIDRLNGEVDKLGEWGRGLDSELNETRETLNREREEARRAHEAGEAELAHERENNQQLSGEIDRLNSEVDKLGEWGRGLDKELSAARETLEREQKEAAHERENNQQLSGEIDRLNGEVERLGTWGKSLDEELSETRANLKREREASQLSAMERKNQRRAQQIALSERDALLMARQDEVEALHRRIAEDEEQARNRQGHIEQLMQSERDKMAEINQLSHELDIVHRRPYMPFIDKLMPFGTRRRFILKMTLTTMRHPIRVLKTLTPARRRKLVQELKRGDVLLLNTQAENCLGGPQIEPVPVVLTEVIEAPDAKAEDYPRIYVPNCEEPTVSIVIPVYNQFYYTYACVKSIVEQTKDIPYEIIIADDCSNDLTTEIQNICRGVRVSRTPVNFRFLLNCNHAAKEARGDYILFLNNDTQVQENWLEPLVRLIESDDTIGMVGSKLIYPDGRLQEAGGILWKDGSAWNYGQMQDASMPEYNYVKDVDYISGASIMIRRKLWEQLGGFDERFAPAYCEDSDLAFSVREAGYRVVYQPQSVVVHFEGVSNGTDTSTGLKHYQVVNQEKFYKKWKRVLDREHNPNAVDPFRARDRSLRKKTLLMVDHYVPQYDKDAGSRTVFQYIRLFVSKGYNVKFIGDNFYPHQPYTTTLQQMGVEVLYGVWYANNWKVWLKEHADCFDYVFLNRPHIAVNYIDFVRENTHAKIVYYGHDLHFLRVRREYELTHQANLLKESKDWLEKELYLMRKADMAYYPSSVEVREIKKIDPSIHVKAIPAYLFEDVPDAGYRAEERENAFFIGGFGHGPNVDAVKWLAKEIMPLLHQRMPELEVHIAGSNMTDEIYALEGNGLVIDGALTDEELIEHYETSRICLVPLRFGAGIKGKVVESLRYGLPVITTACGAEGIDGAENILIHAETPEEFVDTIVSVYEDGERLKALSRAGQAYVRKVFSHANALRVIGEEFQ